MPNEYRIGRLNGRYVISWWEPDGKRRRYRLDAQSRTEAEAEGLNFIRTTTLKASGNTVGEIWALYRAEKSGRRVAKAMEYEWKVMQPFFGNLMPDQVSTEHCRAYIKTRRAMTSRHKRKVNDGTIWTELGHLRSALLWAEGTGLIVKAPKIERPSKPAPKGRWLTDAEVERLLNAPKAHHIQLAILLMLSTAGRIGAILELTWDRVIFEGSGVVNLRTTETGPRKGRAAVPLNDGLRAALSHAKRIAQTDYVVEWAGAPIASIKTGFAAACREAGLEGVSPHTLRHTAAVHLAANGSDMGRISQYLGHSHTSVTERVYARFAPDHLRAEAEILDFTKRLKVV